MCKLLLVVNFVLFASVVRADNNRTFPVTFFFGVGSSAYQTEGAWDEDGRIETIWDKWIHNDVSHVENNDTADIACDSYHKYEADIELARRLGAIHYDISIPWSRIVTRGTSTEFNLKGIAHYQAVITQILANNMFPVVTLYHNDLPQDLQDLGGWTNPKMVDYFVNYAQIAFQYFTGVPFWITFRDPKSICKLGYGEGTAAPGVALDGTADYLCAYVVLKAHAAAYHLYQEKFSALRGQISMAIDFEWSEPSEPTSDAKEEASNRVMAFEFGLYANPIYNGNWPQVVIDRVGSRSNKENFTKSRLPEFTTEEVAYIKGTSDFMAVNLFGTNSVEDIPETEYGDPSYMKDVKANITKDPVSKVAAKAQSILVSLKETYGDPAIFITANGIADDGTSLDDLSRINFYTDFLYNTLEAMYTDNVKVFAYTVWSLLDSFEWSHGYSLHFGLFSVDFTDTNRTRTPKQSADFYTALLASRQVPEPITTTGVPTTTPIQTTTPNSANKIAYCSLSITAIFLSYFLV